MTASALRVSPLLEVADWAAAGAARAAWKA